MFKIVLKPVLKIVYVENTAYKACIFSFIVYIRWYSPFLKTTDTMLSHTLLARSFWKERYGTILLPEKIGTKKKWYTSMHRVYLQEWSGYLAMAFICAPSGYNWVFKSHHCTSAVRYHSFVNFSCLFLACKINYKFIYNKVMYLLASTYYCFFTFLNCI